MNGTLTTDEARAAVGIPPAPLALYAVRLADGTYMKPRKPDGDAESFLFFTDPAHAGNAVVWRKQNGKMAADEDYEVVKLGE